MNTPALAQEEPRLAGAGTVLVLGARAPVALDLARRFAAQGWRVLAGDSASCRITAWSRAVDRSLRLPSARHRTAAWAHALDAAIAHHGIDLVVPTCEETFFLARVRERLPARVRVCTADFDTLARLHSKWAVLPLAAAAGAMVPDSALVETPAQARDWAGGRAVVLKPEFSRFGTHVRLHPRGIDAVDEAFATSGRWVAQALCIGRELCTYAIADRGRLLAHVAYAPAHRLRQGSAYCFVPILNPGLRAFAARFVAHVGFTGQLAFDWIESVDGRCHLIECNPRATSGVHLFAPDAALPAALAGAGDTVIEPVAQPRMLAAAMCGAGAWSALRAGQPRAWWRDWRAARDVIGVRGDRRPLAGALADLCSHAATALRGGGGLRQVLTQDIEWDGRPIVLAAR